MTNERLRKTKKSIVGLRRTRAKSWMLPILQCFDCRAERPPRERRGRSYAHHNLSNKIHSHFSFKADIGRRCTVDSKGPLLIQILSATLPVVETGKLEEDNNTKTTASLQHNENLDPPYQ